MKNILKNTVVIFIVFTTVQIFGQQHPLYTQYYNNFSLINPAYSGSHGLFTGTLNVRSQWAGEPNSPQTQTLSIHGPLGKNVGLGFSIVHDKVSVLDQTDVYADFSYSISPSENSTLAFGLKAGGTFLNVDFLSLGINNDDLFSNNVNKFNPNFGVGVFYYLEKFYASISTVNILKSKHYEKNNVVTGASDEMIFYLSSGYAFNLGKAFKLKPSFLMRAVNGSPLSTDISTSVLWLNKLEFGVSHRIGESVSGLFQIGITKALKIGYSYDAITSDLSNAVGGSHELSLIFDIGKSSKTPNKKPSFYWMNSSKSIETITENKKEEGE